MKHLYATCFAVVVGTVALASGPTATAAPQVASVAQADVLADVRPAKPGHPVDVEKNYSIIEENLLLPHPSEWGGAYVDGDQLVVVTVTRSVEQATDLLRKLGVSRGVSVRTGIASVEQLSLATDAISADLAGKNVESTVGPLYSAGTVAVGVPDSQLGRTAILDISAKVDLPTPPVVYTDSGKPQQTSRWFDTSPFAADFGGTLATS